MLSLCPEVCQSITALKEKEIETGRLPEARLQRLQRSRQMAIVSAVRPRDQRATD